jgi:hypothetical protein
MRTHYGRPGYRPACGLADVRVSMTTDKAKVDCRRCPTTVQWRLNWYEEGKS